MLDRLQANEERAEACSRAGPVTVWGPDGGDLFEQVTALRPSPGEVFAVIGREEAVAVVGR